MPDGSGRYEGTWEKGKLVDGKFIFKDDLVYEEEKWGYCTNKVCSMCRRCRIYYSGHLCFRHTHELCVLSFCAPIHKTRRRTPDS